jgi:hypothetical protein
MEEEQESSAAVTMAMKGFGKAARLAGGLLLASGTVCGCAGGGGCWPQVACVAVLAAVSHMEHVAALGMVPSIVMQSVATTLSMQLQVDL